METARNSSFKFVEKKYSFEPVYEIFVTCHIRIKLFLYMYFIGKDEQFFLSIKL